MSDNDTSSNFGYLIRAARQAKGVSQEDLADECAISRSQLIRWESGNVSRPEPENVRAVCAALDIDPREAVIALGFLTPDEAITDRRLDPRADDFEDLMRDSRISDADKASVLRLMELIRPAQN